MEALKKFEKIYIEISNICNLQCDFCPPVLRNKKIMSIEDFRKTIKKVKNLTKRVCLHLMGEPLGHPHFQEIIQTCEDEEVQVELTTNGVLLNDSKTQMLMSPSVVQVNISIHSFEANHKEKDVEPYLKKVFYFSRVLMEKRPSVYLNYRIWDLNDPRVLTNKNKMIRDKIELEFGFSFHNLNIDVRRKKGYNIINRLYIHFDSRFEWPSLKQPVLQEKGFCHALSHHFGVHADGTIVPCCLDKEADMALGNIHEDDISIVLNSEKALKIKNGFKSRELVEDLCRRCSYIQRF